MKRLVAILMAICILALSACGSDEEYHTYTKKELGSMVYVKLHGVEYAEIELLIEDGKKGVLVYIEKDEVKTTKGKSYVVVAGDNVTAYLSKDDYKLIFN